MTTIKSLRKYSQMAKEPPSWTYYSAQIVQTGVQNPKSNIRLSSMTWSKQETIYNLPEQPQFIHQCSETSLVELWNGLNLICQGKQQKIDFPINSKPKMMMSSEALYDEQTGLEWKSQTFFTEGKYEHQMKDTTKILVELHRNVVK